MKNLKIYSMAALLVSGAALLNSCSSDDELASGGQGYIQLSSVTVDKSLTTRADDGKELAAKIVGPDGTIFAQADDWTTLQGESYLVTAGETYTVSAFSNTGTNDAQGFDAQPYYAGESSVTVKAGTAQTVDVVATLAQAKVSISYTDTFKEYMSDYSAVLLGEDDSEIATFAADETRSAYVKSGQPLSISLTMTPQDANTLTLNNSVVDEAEAAYLYKVVFDVNVEGGSTISVSVDRTIHQYTVTLGVPLVADGVSTTAINGNYSNVWGTFATLEGICTMDTEENAVTFSYREEGATDWISVDAVADEDNANSFSAKVTGLSMGTTYEYKIVCGSEGGDVLTFTTESYEEIPNLDFETWTQSGKNWYANDVANCYEDDGAYWATGNDGVTSTLAGGNDPITTRSDDVRTGTSGTYSAEMHSITGVTLVGAAAGNLFIGKYKTNFSSPSSSVTFGRSYSGARPTKLSGWYKYTPCEINNDGTVPGTLTMDEGHIYVKVYDTDGDHTIDDATIGYGELVITEEVGDWTYFEFDITYTDTTVPAASICIMTTSSHYGGTFSGSKVVGQVGAGSTLYVDDFEVSFD